MTSLMGSQPVLLILTNGHLTLQVHCLPKPSATEGYALEKESLV